MSYIGEDFSYFSQSGQDKFLDSEIFKGKKSGFFIEVGAYDGISFSNTYFFEKYREWQGICIEPIPERFEQLQKNRKCCCISGCVGQNKGICEFLHVMGGVNYGIKDGENTEMLSGLLDAYHPKHKVLIDYELRKYGGNKQVLDMQCHAFSEILTGLGKQRIDYLSLDTEGNELSILETINFKDIDIDVISIEILYPDVPIRSFMKSKGYSLIKRCEYDDIYKKN